MKTADSLCIIGCGYIGKRLAALALKAGYEVSGLVRSPDKCNDLQRTGILTVTGNLDDEATIPSLPVPGKILIYCVPPPGGGVTDPRVRNFCTAIPDGHEPEKLIYLSTSAVYGGEGSDPVTEETPANPQTTRGKRRLDAETVLTGWGKKHGVPVIILRVTGIYGPGRLPLQFLLNGSPVLYEEEAPVTNRIHADDLARICLAAAEKGTDGDIFNVSDGEQGTMTGYFNAVADLLGLDRPRQVAWEEASREMPPLLFSYFSEGRKIDSSRMLRRLGVALTYPTLADGLPSCIPDGWEKPLKK